MPRIFALIRSRRAFLRDLGLFGLMGALGGALWWRNRVPSWEESGPTLRALVETMLPSAGGAPADMVSGVTDSIRSIGRDDSELRDVIRAGLQWFDRRAEKQFGKSFGELARAQRDNVVEIAAAAPQGSVERGCFDRMRHLTIGLALAEPAMLSGIPYSNAPLPRGYPDQAKPPSSG